MGGEISPSAKPAASPKFALMAIQDVGTADASPMPLQRMQIIKGWIDAEGGKREQVYDVAGDANNGATVDLETCKTQGLGAQQLCTVWQDPNFDASLSAYYYARVLENPSCRWSQQMCVANQVDCSKPSTIGKGFEGCCAKEHRPTIQERAWTSPIWYKPQSALNDS